ncbi:hypothetical protein [Kineococcus rubinsiae]|uniref:hypothetical protein n=1 Tax=Kineococcus rubinsiae TaxID=2609562 RepID=UPI001431E6DF|nr:hypothetical protein [Kineococcus rubinsiae]NIZ92283.1 hypothetical protein [Kineococcus rubinsiae]
MVLDVVRDLVIGDDWRMVAGIAAMLLVITGGRAAGLPVWWLPPVTVLVMLGVGVCSAPPVLRRHRR